MNFRIAPLSAEHVLKTWELNQRFANELSSLHEAEFRQHLSICATSIVALNPASQLVAFALALDECSQYASLNYRWFCDRYDRFLYVDRIAILPEWQRCGLGRKLYKALAKFAIDTGRKRLCCEFNSNPPNLRSRGFHARLGFRSVGVRKYLDCDREVSMQLLNLSLAGRPGS